MSEPSSERGIRSAESAVSDSPCSGSAALPLARAALNSINNGDSARAVFLAWEKLRVLYNLGLIWVVLTIAPYPSWSAALQDDLIEKGIGANLCFCAGPCAEGYLTFLGANRQLVRWMLFVAGFLFACFLTWASFIPDR